MQIKPVIGLEGLYEVSDTGVVWSLNYRRNGKRRELRPDNDAKGYQIVGLYKNGCRVKHSVHRIVASAFIQNPESKRTVNHKNGVKSDNRVQNLEWNTYSENNHHSYKHLGRKPKFGGDSPLAKGVHQFTKLNQFVKSFRSVADAGRETGLGYRSISGNARGETKTAGGFVWVYA